MRIISGYPPVLVLGFALMLTGCTETPAEENEAQSRARVQENGGIDIQAPGVDIQIDPTGVNLDVDTDGDGKTK